MNLIQALRANTTALKANTTAVNVLRLDLRETNDLLTEVSVKLDRVIDLLAEKEAVSLSIVVGTVEEKNP